MNSDVLQHYQGYQLLVKRLEQAVIRYQKYQYPIDFDFYNLDEIEVIEKFLGKSVEYQLLGGYCGALRKLLVIGSDIKENDYITCLKAKYNSKFVSLDNRDVKGALYNCGIDVSKTGDFFVQDSAIHIYCKKDISDWLINNFVKIANVSVKFEECSFVDQQFNFINFKVTVNSLRLDKVVSAIIKKSREIAKDKINSGLVNVNFKEIDKCDYLCQLNDIISLKKIGRFQIKDIQENTKSGKIILSIDKYS